MSPIPSFDDDLAYVLEDVGEVVVYGTQKGSGLLDTTALEQFDSTQFEFRGPHYALLVREGAFAGLTMDTGITHAGVSYTIKDIGTARTDGLRALLVVKGAGPAPATTSNTFGGGAVFG